MSFKQLCHRFQVPGLEFQKSFAFAAKERWAFSLHFWTVLIIAAISFARTWLILTVGEGEAGSDVTFCDPSLKVTDKEESKDWKMQHSHDHCPHSSAGLPATLCLSDFGRIHEESFFKLYLYCFFLSLSPFLCSFRGFEWKLHSWEVQAVPWACWRWCWFGTEICDLRTGRTASVVQPPCVQTAAAQICEEKATLVWWGIFIGRLEGLFIDLEG